MSKSGQNDGWGRRVQPEQNGGNQPHQPIQADPHRHGDVRHQHSYASMGTYSSMNRGPPPQQCHHGIHGREYYGMDTRDHREGEFRRQSMGNAHVSMTPVCKFFQKGYCREGQNCRYRHDGPHSNVPDFYRRPSDRHTDNRSERHASDTRSLGSDRHGADNVPVSSDTNGVDQYGRHVSPKGGSKGGGHQSNSAKESQRHNFARSDSNRSVGSTNSGVNGSGSVSSSFAMDHQPSPDFDSSSKWSKVKLNEGPSKKRAGKSGNDATDNSSRKKTIKWSDIDQTRKIVKLNYCRIAGHNHLWSECPENKFGKNYKAAPPKLTAEESNAMYRAALENAAAASDKPSAAQPDMMAKSINSLNGTSNLRNNTLKQPPLVVPSKTSTLAPAKSAAGPNASAAIPRRNSNAAALLRKNSSELKRKDSLLIDTAASKLQAAGHQLNTPTPQNGQQQQKTFVPRSQRAMAKRPSPDQPSPTNKKRKASVLSFTSPVGRHQMTKKNGHWKKVSVDVAPAANDNIVIPLTKHTSTRLLNTMSNPFDILDQEAESKEAEKEDSGAGTNVDFDSYTEGHPTRTSSNDGSNAAREAVAKSIEVICLDSSSDEEDHGGDKMDDQPTNRAFLAKEKEIETADIKATAAASDEIDDHPTKPPPTDSTEGSNTDDADHLQEDSIDNNERVQNNAGASQVLNDEDGESIPEITRAEDAAVSDHEDHKEGHDKDTNDFEKATDNDPPSHSTVSEEDSDVREQQKRRLVFTNAQIDEMEDDFLDYVEWCVKNFESSNSSSEDGFTHDDESSVSDQSHAEGSDDDKKRGTPAEQTLSNQNSPQHRSDSRNSNSLSASTPYSNLSQRADNRSGTPPPLFDKCNNGPVDSAEEGEFEEYYTCNYCQLVFESNEEADDHEKMCSFESALGPVFHDNVELCRNIMRNADGKCYFKPKPSHPLQEKTQKATWEMKYNAVVHFHQDHGNLDLPKESTSSLGNLYQWLHQQKYKLRNNTLKPNRANKIRKLFETDDDNGIVSPQQPATNEDEGKKKKTLWNDNYRAIRRFFNKNDHLNLPDEVLRRWLDVQRGKLRAGKLGTKHAKKMKELLDLADDFCVMQSVEHLSSTDVSTGLPQQKIVVLDTYTEILHQFQTEVRQSSIAGSGRGVFLTYLGAKVLKPDASARSSKLITKHMQLDSLIHQSLSAVDQFNNRMTVQVSPNSLFPNENNHLITKKRSAAYDKQLKKNALCDFNEDKATCSVHNEVQKLRSNIPEKERIGQLGINTIEDYQDDNNILFWSNNMIELGRYGPFRPEDRKPELFLNIKNFLFEYEPSEWQYEIDEPVERTKRARNENGKPRKMMIDITDDATGQVHELAQQYSSIYVNEIGHTDLHENVFISTNGEAGAVYYYISIDEQHAMKKGDTVELLVNYGEHYEDIRERKGYGMKNQKEGLGCDSEDKAARLQRNFFEREQAEQDIVDIGFIELYLLVRFVTEKIYLPINRAMQGALSNSRHIIARRRMHWLIKILERRLEVLLQHRTKVMTASLVGQVRKWIKAWAFNHETIHHKILTGVMPESGKQVIEAIREEIAEGECLYFVLIANKSSLKILLTEVNMPQTELYYECCKGPDALITNPLDESVWSQIAISLMTHCALKIAHYMNISSRGSQESIAADLLKSASISKNAVQKASRIINKGSDAEYDKALLFLVLKPRSKKADQRNTYSHFRNSIYLRTPLPYEETAILAEYQAYHDAIDLCHLDCPRAEPKAILAESNDSQLILMSKSHKSHSIPRTVDAIRRKVAQVDGEWYLLHHVVLVVHALASLVEWNDKSSDDGKPFYSLEKLCAAVEIDKHKAEALIKRGCTIPARTQPRSPQKARKSTQGTPTKKKRLGQRTSPRSSASKKSKIPKAKAGKSVNSSSPESRIVKEGPDPDFPGWNIRTIARLTDRNHVDNVWYKPQNQHIIIRSRTGVRAINKRMEETGEDFVSTCTHVLQTDGKAYFASTRFKKSP